MHRGHQAKNRRREEALERAKSYKAPKNPTGLREKVRRGLVSFDEAIDLTSDYNNNIQAWLRRRKDMNVKTPTNNTESPKKKARGKQKRKNARNNKKSIL
jgi:hypothetical protein